MKTMQPKDISLCILVIILTGGLVLISKITDGFILVSSYSAPVNKHIAYQLTTVLIAIAFLGLLNFLKPDSFKKFFKLGNIKGKVTPAKFVGINPKEHENWLHVGINFSVIITTVTALLIYFQLVKEKAIAAETIISLLPFSLLFALSNSFVEESITRLGVVIILADTIDNNKIPFLSGILFGTVHYWGNPGGVPGVSAAGFLGWLLAKSIIETRGIFWAWLIHFLQDVVIFSAILSIN
jgi:hypothetical protein